MISDHISTAQERRIYNQSHITELSRERHDVERLPNTFNDWKCLLNDYPSGCLFWMTNNSFVICDEHVSHLDNLLDQLPKFIHNEIEFPEMLWLLKLKDDFTVYLFAISDMEALGILHEMVVQYTDFHQCNLIEYPFEEEKGTIPTLLLKEILERVDTTGEYLTLANILFKSEFSGRVLALSGRNTNILFRGCDILPVAQDAFVKAMTTKEDETIGLTDVHMYKPYLFDDQILFSLLKGGTLRTLALYGYMFNTTPLLIYGPNYEPFLQGLLEAIRDSHSLRCLKIPYCLDFRSYEIYANFVNGLRSNSLLRLDISFDECRDQAIPLPVDSLRDLSLTCLSLENVVLGRTRWNKLLEELGKCTTLTSLTLNHAEWQEVDGTQAAVEFRNFLQQNSNIDSLETVHFFENGAYQMHIVPLLEYNQWQKKILSLYEHKRKLRSALIAEALGDLFHQALTKIPTHQSKC